jgi:hypothetical protein
VTPRPRIALAVGVLAACSLVVAACGSNPLHLVSPTLARSRAEQVHRHWALHVRLFAHPRVRRPWLIARKSDRRLLALERHYRFSIVTFTYMARKQAASLVIQTDRPVQEFAHDVNAIERGVDPLRNGGFGYRAFFFEARSGDGVPFIATQHSFSNAHGQLEGEQWARGPTLFPFAHG